MSNAIKSLLFISILIFLPLTVKADDEPYDDLAMESITISPSKPMVNQYCRITVKIKNGSNVKNLFTSQGISSYFFDFKDFFKEDTNYTSPSIDTPIAPGGYINYVFYGRFLSPGIKKLNFVADNRNELDEKNEDNNSGLQDVTVFNLNDSDLKVKEIIVDKTNPLVNSDVKIQAIIENSGLTSLTSSAGLDEEDVTAIFSGFTPKTKNRPAYPTMDDPFDPGETFTYTYEGFFNKIGDNSLKFIIDDDRDLVESSEGNNSTTTLVSVFANEADRDNFFISNIKVSDISSTSVEISWDTNVPTSGYVVYKRTEVELEYQSEIIPESVNHKVVIKDLEIGKNYSFRVVSQKGTVIKNSEYQNFKPVEKDLIIIINGPNANTELDKAQISWNTNLLSSGYVYYKKSGGTGYLNFGSDVKAITHSVMLSGLEAGTYNFFVVSTSSAETVCKSNFGVFAITAHTCSTDCPSNSASVTPINAPLNNSSESAAILPVASKIISNSGLYSLLKGRIVLKVESAGEAYYIDPAKKEMYYLGKPEDAFNIMRQKGIGISDVNLNKIPVGIVSASGLDSDFDGLSDIFEEVIKTNKSKKDSDGDGYSDMDEIKNGFNPSGAGKCNTNSTFASAQIGKILLQVEGKGEAWFVNPIDKKRYFLGRPADAFNVMRKLGLGISNANFNAM